VRLATLAAVVATGVVALGGTATVATPPARQVLAHRPVAESMFSPADVVAMQMFNPHDGVGVAGLPPLSCQRPCLGGPPGAAYVVVTEDGGRNWRATGRVPADFGPFFPSSEMAFQSQSAGYLQSGTTIYTDNGGRTWLHVEVPGVATALSLEGRSLWVASDICPPGQLAPALCPSDLLVYRLGHLRPTLALPVPDTDHQAHRYVRATTMAASLLDRLGPSSAVVEEGSEGLPSSIMVTADSGHHWQVVDDPCEGLAPSGLIAPSPGHWLLLCELAGGMEQGNVRLYGSTDSGRRWRLLDAANEQHTSLGNLGDGLAYDLALSGNGRVVWLLGVAGGVGASTDGGRHWDWAKIETSEADLATAGATGAWLPVPYWDLYRTINGTGWTKVGRPPL